MKLLIVFCLQAFLLYAEYSPAARFSAVPDEISIGEYNHIEFQDYPSTGFPALTGIPECHFSQPESGGKQVQAMENSGEYQPENLSFYIFDLPPPELA